MLFGKYVYIMKIVMNIFIFKYFDGTNLIRIYKYKSIQAMSEKNNGWRKSLKDYTSNKIELLFIHGIIIFCNLPPIEKDKIDL